MKTKNLLLMGICLAVLIFVGCSKKVDLTVKNSGWVLTQVTVKSADESPTIIQETVFSGVLKKDEEKKLTVDANYITVTSGSNTVGSPVTQKLEGFGFFLWNAFSSKNWTCEITKDAITFKED